MLKKVIAIVMCASFLLFAVACKSEDQIQQSTQQGNSRHEVVITQEPAEPQNVLKVNGSGEVTAIPDIAEISLAVVTQDKDAAEAERLNNEAMNAVMEALYGFNIEENDIESSYFNLYPMYDYSNNKESITGYRVNNEIRVVVRDLDKLGEILSAAMAAGANDVGNIAFRLEDASEAYRNALKAAVADAEMKVSAMAEGAGIQVSDVPYSIIEASYSMTPTNYDTIETVLAAEAPAEENSVASRVPVSRGELSVSAKVEVKYLIEGKSAVSAEN